MSHQFPDQKFNSGEERHIDTLLQLTLGHGNSAETLHRVASLTAEERDLLISLAGSHHVILRALQPVLQHATATGSADLASWAGSVIESEQARIGAAVRYLYEICQELEAAGCPVTVMKSLDHWPDLGSDLDLYSSAHIRGIRCVLEEKFKARLAARSWGDRLANKWNFMIPGLPESVELHVQRLGQTGEHTRLAQRFISRRTEKEIHGMRFPVPAPEEQIVVATLQRMYRHFYFRICDILNSAALVESDAVDFAELRRATAPAGIWEGTATYLVIVSDYVRRYRGYDLKLPSIVHDAASFRGDKIKVRERFLRMPLIPEGAKLFTLEVKRAALNGDIPATLRLNLLPPLAVAAAVAYKLTGSDKGVW